MDKSASVGVQIVDGCLVDFPVGRADFAPLPAFELVELELEESVDDDEGVEAGAECAEGFGVVFFDAAARIFFLDFEVADLFADQVEGVFEGGLVPPQNSHKHIRHVFHSTDELSQQLFVDVLPFL